MKKTLFATVLLALALSVRAEVATLKHGDELTAFYTSTALQSALNAAVAGDVINLSSGYYTCSEINKAVTIIGAGMEAVEEHNISPTIIESSVAISQTDENASLKLEGLCFNYNVYTNAMVYNLMVMRCKFKTPFNSSSQASLSNANFVNCLFLYSSMNGWNEFFGKNSFTNCFISNLRHSGANTYLNCIIHICPENTYNYENHNFINCIIYKNICYYYNKNVYSNYSSRSNYTYLKYADHCISTTNDGYPISGASNYTNEGIFATFKGDYTDGELFKLTEDGAKILGTDGTQIGMQGGVMPYDPKPTNIQIESCKVPLQTDANGKLNISIKLREKETAEE